MKPGVYVIKLSFRAKLQMYWALFKAWIKNPRQYYRNKREAKAWVENLYKNLEP